MTRAQLISRLFSDKDVDCWDVFSLIMDARADKKYTGPTCDVMQVWFKDGSSIKIEHVCDADGEHIVREAK